MRLFLAIALPDALRGDLASIQAGLRPSTPGWRWVRPEGIHLTLRFLGELDGARDTAARESWRRIAAGSSGPVRFRRGGLGVFPGASRPRVLWVAVEEEADAAGRLASLARELEAEARRIGFAPETKHFRPHLTLARAAGEGRPAVPVLEPTANGALVEVDEIVLFRSELDPRGARYTRLAAFPLGRFA